MFQAEGEDDLPLEFEENLVGLLFKKVVTLKDRSLISLTSKGRIMLSDPAVLKFTDLKYSGSLCQDIAYFEPSTTFPMLVCIDKSRMLRLMMVKEQGSVKYLDNIMVEGYTSL